MRPDATFDETLDLGAGRFRIRCFPADWIPPIENTVSAHGFCFTDDGLLALVGSPDTGFGLPGGTLEAGEQVEDALRREIQEEISARVIASFYLGTQLVEQVDGDRSGYQSRYWCRIELDDYVAEKPGIERLLLPPEEFDTGHVFGRNGNLQLFLARAREVERRTRA